MIPRNQKQPPWAWTSMDEEAQYRDRSVTLRKLMDAIEYALRPLIGGKMNVQIGSYIADITRRIIYEMLRLDVPFREVMPVTVDGRRYQVVLPNSVMRLLDQYNCGYELFECSGRVHHGSCGHCYFAHAKQGQS